MKSLMNGEAPCVDMGQSDAQLDSARSVSDRAAGAAEQGQLSWYQALILLLCGLCVILDGFDVQAIGYVAPAIKHDWGIAAAQLGPVFGAGLFGMVVGSLALSVLSDRVGRRPVMIGATLLFGAGMLITARVQSLHALLIMRFVCGIGLGAIMPNALALTSEYSPSRHRIFLVMLMASSYSVGAAIGGAIAAWMIPVWGWRSVFVTGGTIPLVLSAFMIFLLPESIQMMIRRGVDPDRIAVALRRVTPGVRSAEMTGQQECTVGSVPVVALFQEGRKPITLLLWFVHFMNLADLYFMANWLPTLMKDSGLSMRTAVLSGTTLQIGSIAGALFLAQSIKKFGFYRVLPLNYAVGFVAIASIGFAVHNVGLLFSSIFVAGFCVIGGLNGLNALASASYPTSMRSTGVGWSLGIGRFGSIFAPVLGGFLISLQWSDGALFMVAAVPALALVAALTAMKRITR